METKDPMSTETSGARSGTEAREPESTATSSDTLSDIEETEQTGTATEATETGGGASDAPSPDGQFDGSRSETSGTDETGPM